jgi:4-amino-4-deoxy-L-arabinose transferase-like glycosyltransferase
MPVRGEALPSTRWMGPLLLLGVAASLLLPMLCRQALTDPDESAYVESVREMRESGEWLIPHLYGQPILDKPILIYWTIAASFRLFGENSLGARMPSVLAGVALLFVLWRLGALILGSFRAGLLSALVLASSLEFVLLGRAAVTDMLLTLFCTLGVLLYLERLWAGGSRHLPLAGAACLGLAVLTKGPVGLVVGVLALGACLTGSREWKRLPELRPLASAAVFCAVALPWYVAVAMRRPDLMKGFVLGGNLGRFMRAEHRPEPPLYYLVVLVIGFLPWSSFLPGAMSRAFAAWRSPDAERGRLLAPTLWLLALMAFFTLAASKLPSYILPALPAAAIIAAEPRYAWLEPGQEGRRLRGTGGMLLLIILAGGMVFFAMGQQTLGSIPASFKQALLPACFAGLLGSLFVLSSLILRRPLVGLLLLLAGNFALIFSLIVFGFPLLEPWKSSKEAAYAVRPMLQPDDRILMYRLHHPSFGYYLHRIPDLVRKESDLTARLKEKDRVFCLMGHSEYVKLKARYPELPAYLLKSVGHVAVVTNRPPGGFP